VDSLWKLNLLFSSYPIYFPVIKNLLWLLKPIFNASFKKKAANLAEELFTSIYETSCKKIKILGFITLIRENKDTKKVLYVIDDKKIILSKSLLKITILRKRKTDLNDPKNPELRKSVF